MQSNLWAQSLKRSAALSDPQEDGQFKITNIDWWLVVGMLLLLILGTMTILSTELTPGIVILNNKLFVSQLFNLVLGLGLFLVFARIDYRLFKHFSLVFYILTLGILGIVLLIGYTSHGSVRWIDLGFTNFQPSEVSKILVTIFLASYFSGLREKIRQLQYIVLSLGLVLIPTVLVLIEPNLGTALVFVAIWLGMIILAGIRTRHLLIFISLGLLILPIAWFFILAPYQKDRIYVFMDPKQDALGKGYSVIQSVIAVGSGKLTGRGWGRGTQSHLQFLPERHTDFIFATFAEELGFLGVCILLFAFGLLLMRILKAIQTSSDSFGSFLGIGIFMNFMFQIIVNIGMNLGIMPITGIPLPLISYGGTSLLTSFISLGIVESIVLHKTVPSPVLKDDSD